MCACIHIEKTMIHTFFFTWEFMLPGFPVKKNFFSYFFLLIFKPYHQNLSTILKKYFKISLNHRQKIQFHTKGNDKKNILKVSLLLNIPDHMLKTLLSGSRKLCTCFRIYMRFSFLASFLKASIYYLPTLF